MPSTCCIFQPFDDGPFDKRYDEVLAPAVEAAGLRTYRVDRDPSATIPIEKLQEEVERSTACLADISADNPNVWYELGFAVGRNRPVVLICTANRESFPFDIRHRRVIRYKSDSPTDFEQLGFSITQALKAEVEKAGLTQSISDYSPLKERKGLRDHEIAALAFIMANARINNWTSRLNEDMERAGFTRLATNLALDSLRHSGFITLGSSSDEDTEEENEAAFLTNRGKEWLRINQDELLRPRLLNRQR
ncbi:MAG: hypothetical protein ACREQR_13545 [Candidatus Binataceae bacterium]